MVSPAPESFLSKLNIFSPLLFDVQTA